MKHGLDWLKDPFLQALAVVVAAGAFLIPPSAPPAARSIHHPDSCHACSFTASPEHRQAFDSALLRAGFIEVPE